MGSSVHSPPSLCFGFDMLGWDTTDAFPRAHQPHISSEVFSRAWQSFSLSAQAPNGAALRCRLPLHTAGVVERLMPNSQTKGSLSNVIITTWVWEKTSTKGPAGVWKHSPSLPCRLRHICQSKKGTDTENHSFSSRQGQLPLLRTATQLINCFLES